ncbi:MAG: homoserine kinase [Peptococcaceae bacterium]|nr:homoserine kinase [Peptococcaceae bacterium]
MKRIRIPATTANMGPGFDCIGMAFDMYNYIDFEPTGVDGYCELTSDGDAGHIDLSKDNLIYKAYAAVFQYLQKPVMGIKMHFENNVPYSRGLGSSSAALIGGVKVANEVLGNPLSDTELLNVALQFEGHPDNIAPALLGGVVISGLDENGDVFYSKITPPENLHCTVIIPDYPLATKKARAVLPQQFSMQDAVYNVGRMAMLIDAMHTGKLEQLALAMNDKLHQPYRMPLIKGMDEIVPAAKALGALNVTISGAGPTILIVSDGKKDFSSLQDILTKHGVTARITALQPVNEGAALV